MISNIIPLFFITAAIVLSFLFSHIVYVTVNSVDAGACLVTGSYTMFPAF